MSSKRVPMFRMRPLATLILIYIFYSAGLQGSNDKPNFIVILADDMGYSDLGCTGSEIETPHLDILAKNGLLFTNLYNTARCCPTRASLLTGLYSHNAGVGYMDSDSGYPGYRGHLSENAVTIAEVLGEKSYQTILSGKWHLGGVREYWPDRRGFQKFYGVPKGGGLYFYPSRFIDRKIYRNGEHIEPEDPNYYTTDAFTTEALKFIAESNRDGKPFFLYLAYVAPHYPLQAHEEDIQKHLGKYKAGYEAIRNARFKKQKRLGIVNPDTKLSPIHDGSVIDDVETMDRKMAVYAAQMDNLDQNVGRLVKGLMDMKLFENTLILFMSDNGAVLSEVDWELDGGPRGEIGTNESFVSYGKHWGNVSNTPFRKYKSKAHEGGVVSPLIAHWPNGIKRHQKVREVVHVIDIFPTLLELANVDYPKRFRGHRIKPLQGASFSNVIKGESLESDRSIFWEHMGNSGVRKGDLKAVRTHGQPWELYNLSSDPTELDDLAEVRPQDLGRLKIAYKKWAKENGVMDWPLPGR